MSGRQIQQVFARAMAFCASHGGDCSVYAALLKFCVSQGTPERAVDVWKAIQRVQLCINSFGFCPTTVIHALPDKHKATTSIVEFYPKNIILM